MSRRHTDPLDEQLAAAAALDELRSTLRITVRDRGHALLLVAAWEHGPIDGSHIEWSAILHGVAVHLLDS